MTFAISKNRIGINQVAYGSHTVYLEGMAGPTAEEMLEIAKQWEGISFYGDWAWEAHEYLKGESIAVSAGLYHGKFHRVFVMNDYSGDVDFECVGKLWSYETQLFSDKRFRSPESFCTNLADLIVRHMVECESQTLEDFIAKSLVNREESFLIGLLQESRKVVCFPVRVFPNGIRVTSYTDANGIYFAEADSEEEADRLESILEYELFAKDLAIQGFIYQVLIQSLSTEGEWEEVESVGNVIADPYNRDTFRAEIKHNVPQNMVCLLDNLEMI